MSTFLTFSFHHYINYSACVTKNYGVTVYIVATSCDHACDCHTVATSPHKCDYTHCMQTHNHYGIWVSVHVLSYSYHVCMVLTLVGGKRF